MTDEMSLISNKLSSQYNLNMTDTDSAFEGFFPLDQEISLFYRAWGDKDAGIPVLFVHGGPGNCIADYKETNAKFFEPSRYYVIEVDQRGCGKSTPSVQADISNAKYYLDISIAQMSNDFERLRMYLGIEKWLVFGGSWGSTLSIDYAQRYAEKCLGLIIRGIYLNTKPEFDAIYARSSFAGNEKKLKDFDVFFELAQQEVARRGETELDPNDSERFIRLYEAMIQRGDRDACWRFYVFENNLAADSAEDWLDPFTISNETELGIAGCISFFECRLFLRGTFEDVVDLLGPMENIKNIPTWVVQGTGDECCPDMFARQLVDRLVTAGVTHKAQFVEAGHRASSSGITIALKAAVDDFYSNVKK